MGPVRLSVLHAEVFRFPAPWTFPAAELPYSILRLIRAGTGDIDVDGVRQEVRTGDLVLISEGSVLSCWATSSDFSFGSIRFSATLDAQGMLAVEPLVPAFSDAGADEAVRAHFDAVIEAWADDSKGRALRASGHLAVVLGTVADLMAQRGGTARPRRGRPIRHRVRDPRIARVVEHLRADLRRTPEPAVLCAMAHMSESTLRRTFKEQTGKTIVAYLREERMAAAARRIAFGDESIGEIAVAVGMPDANYFARTFREVFSVSPSEYRRLTSET